MNPALRGLRAATELAAAKPHGNRVRYMGGCRCADCRRANTEYEKGRARARKAGDWNGIVDAARASAHLRRLSRIGIGRRVVSEVSSVPESILHEVKRGRRLRIRARTERRILAVGRAQASDAALVPAGGTWRLIDELIEEGYSVSFLARRLGYAKPALQFNRGLITVRNAARVQRLHRELTE